MTPVRDPKHRENRKKSHCNNFVIMLGQFRDHVGISFGSLWNHFAISHWHYVGITLRLLGMISGHFGTTLESLWDQYGIISKSFWDHFKINLKSHWHHFGPTLGSIWDPFEITLKSHFGITLERLGDYLGCSQGHFRTTLESLWDQFSIISRSFRDHFGII